MKRMAWLRSKLVIAFDAASVSGATLSRGFGAPRLARVESAPLEPGALVPSPVEANLVRPEAVLGALRLVLAELGAMTSPATLVLPDGLARVLVFEAPQAVVPAEYARFRLGAGLPFSPSEAIVDVQPLGEHRFLGVAVRRSIVAAYEALAAAAGVECERVDLSPMAALEGLRRQAPQDASAVDVILGDAALSLAAWRSGRLLVFRSRRRDSGVGEAARLCDEVLRTAALAGDGAAAPRVRVVGPGATSLVRELRSTGTQAEAGWQATGASLSLEAAEVPWLGVALS
jgi:Tfp pilus assembly PilM family ATPase